MKHGRRRDHPRAARTLTFIWSGWLAAARGGFAGHVAIRGGRTLYLECRGTGRPAVVLEAGTGARAPSLATLSSGFAGY